MVVLSRRLWWAVWRFPCLRRSWKWASRIVGLLNGFQCGLRHGPASTYLTVSLSQGLPLRGASLIDSIGPLAWTGFHVNHVNAVLLSHAGTVSLKFPKQGFSEWTPNGVHFWGPKQTPQKRCPPTVGGHLLGGPFLIPKWHPFWGQPLGGCLRGSV